MSLFIPCVNAWIRLVVSLMVLVSKIEYNYLNNFCQWELVFLLLGEKGWCILVDELFNVILRCGCMGYQPRDRS
jgi:hypothetical protein